MAMRFSVLQRKLQELELQLNQVFSLPSDTLCHQLLADGIQQRFLFLNNLLSAETLSQPKKPLHLHHIEHRLAQLRSAFHAWDEFRTSAPDHVETGSPCSCTQSCLNEDEGDDSSELGSLVYEDPEGFFEEVGEEKKTVEMVAGEAERNVKMEERVLIEGCHGVLIVGMILVSLVMVMLSPFLDRMEHEYFPPPT